MANFRISHNKYLNCCLADGGWHSAGGALVFENRITENKDAFIQKVNAISKDLSINPNWLMTVMNSESRVDHRAVNIASNATGLIQFMPDTARGLGTTVDALKKMSNVAQLDYVKKYFQGGKYNSYLDLYLKTFYPRGLTEKDNFILGSEVSDARARKIAQQNKAIDLNNDGYITLKEFKEWTKSRIPKDALQILSQTLETVQKNPGKTGMILLGIGLLATGLYFYTKK